MPELYAHTLKYFHLAIIEFLPVLENLKSAVQEKYAREEIEDLIEAYKDIDAKIERRGLNYEDPNKRYDGERHDIYIDIPDEMIENLSRLSHRLLLEWKNKIDRLQKKKYLTDSNKEMVDKFENLIWPLEAFLKTNSYVIGKYYHLGPLIFPGEKNKPPLDSSTEIATPTQSAVEVIRTIKSRLKTNDLFIESRSQGEDQHLLIGKRDGTPEKAHLIIDGKTGEIRVEDNQQEPTNLIQKIESVLTLQSGKKIRTTRESLEEMAANSEQRPQLDLAQNFTVTGGSEGNFIEFQVKNDGAVTALDIQAELIADGSVTSGKIDIIHNLSPQEESRRIVYRYTDTDFFQKNLDNPRIIFTYRAANGQQFSSGRKIIQDTRADGRFNIHSKPGEYFEV